MTEDQTATDVEDRTAEEVPETAAVPEQVVEQEPVDVEASADEPADVEAAAGEDQVEGEQTELPVEGEVVIDDDTMRQALEAILMVTDEPLPVLTMARAVGRPTGDVSAALATLADEYTEQGRGFDLREVGGGWRYYTRPESAQYVERFVLDGQQARLTQAALETLAVVAYKQPVSRARVSAIRGVNVDGVMRTLVSRGLVEEAGSDTESQATLYRTTSYFLERLGMQSLDDLPELAPYLPEMDDVEEELAAQNAPAQAAEAAEPAETGQPAETEELAPAEELEAGGDTELEQEESDPDEIPETEDTPAETDPDESDDEDDDEGDEDESDDVADFDAGMGYEVESEAVDDVLRDDEPFPDEDDVPDDEDDAPDDDVLDDDVLGDDVLGDAGDGVRGDGVLGDGELAPAEELEAGETQYRVDRDD